MWKECIEQLFCCETNMFFIIQQTKLIFNPLSNSIECSWSFKYLLRSNLSRRVIPMTKFQTFFDNPLNTISNEVTFLHDFLVILKRMLQIRFRITGKSRRNVSLVPHGMWCYQQVQIFNYTLVCCPTRKKKKFDRINFRISKKNSAEMRSWYGEGILAKWSMKKSWMLTIRLRM